MEKSKYFFEYQKTKFRGSELYKDVKWLRYQFRILKYNIKQVAEIAGVSETIIEKELKKYNGKGDKININNDYYINISRFKLGIYFIQETLSKAIKIGYTTDIKKRLKMLQIANPNRLKILAFIKGSNRTEEKKLHKTFAEYNIRGEWFKPAPKLLVFIKKNK